MSDLVPGLREAARILRHQAAILRGQGFGETAAKGETWARTLEGEADAAEALSERDPTDPRTSVTCPWCRKELLP